MACSKYEYVKLYENEHYILRNCWFVVRIDGRCFTKFTADHDFEKPNDIRGINVMNAAAEAVMEEFTDVILSYGQSDEYSFVFSKKCDLWSRREVKIVTNLVSCFTANYVMKWNEFFPEMKLKRPPQFDGRVVTYPSDKDIRDYLSWRQVDCMGRDESYGFLNGTDTEFKNELLFTKFGINYSKIDPVYRKGTIVIRRPPKVKMSRQEALLRKDLPKEDLAEEKKLIRRLHVDLINDSFWKQYPHILGTEN